MNENEKDLGYNRRDFLKGGSMATLMTMLGGVQLFAQTNEVAAPAKTSSLKAKVAVIGLGAWGREILNTLALLPEAEIVAICDNYAASLKRAASIVPQAAKVADYKAVLENKDVKAVVIATPTHQHKEIVLAALKADKHVYCEAPLAATIEEAKEIALAAKAAKKCLFQAGLQTRSDPQRHFMLPFVRSGALGQWAMIRAQWHKKTSWRVTSPNPEREKELNWRLVKESSVGLVGELGCHTIDSATWFLNGLPTAVTGIGSIALWKDGREVPDTVQATFEYPNRVFLNYDATLANSFDAAYEMMFGSDAALMVRDDSAWMFKEVDSPLLGWEVYAKKQLFYKETGIVIKAGSSKSVPTEQAAEPKPFTKTPLSFALTNFLRNTADAVAAAEDYIASFGADDADGLGEQISKVQRRAGATYLEGYQATVASIKANEAILKGARIELKPELFELG